MPNINITLSEADYKALEAEANDVNDWVENIALSRAHLAGDQIIRDYTTRALSEGVQIPTTRDEVIIDAFARGWVQTAAEKSAEFTAALLAKHRE
jgi:hypothetical protein